MEEQETEWEYTEDIFGVLKDPWFEGEDQPSFPSITKVLIESEN